MLRSLYSGESVLYWLPSCYSGSALDTVIRAAAANITMASGATKRPIDIMLNAVRAHSTTAETQTHPTLFARAPIAPTMETTTTKADQKKTARSPSSRASSKAEAVSDS